MRAWLFLLLVPLAGCAEETGTWHMQGTQCEAYPWGDQYGGEAAEAGLEERLEAYYGFDFEDARTVDDGKAYTAACGTAGAQHVQVTVKGHASELKADGWQRGEAPSD